MQRANGNLKPRLTEREDIRDAIAFLMSQGRRDADVTEELVRHFYVDLDALNSVLAIMRRRQ